MILYWQSKSIAEWPFVLSRTSHLKASSCLLSVYAALVQSDYLSGDEKLNCVSDNPGKSGSFALNSDSVVRTLRCLRRKPSIAFTYFKDSESLGFRHDFSTYSEIIQILSHSRRGKMLVSLFSQLLKSTRGGGGLEILHLINDLQRNCHASYAVSFVSNCVIKAYTVCCDSKATIDIFTQLCKLGIPPSIWTCNLLLKFVAESGESDMVVTAYDQMKCFRLIPDVHTFDIVIRSLFQATKVDEAFQVFNEMMEMGVKLDARGYSTFVIGLCDCGKHDLAYLPCVSEIGSSKFA